MDSTTIKAGDKVRWTKTSKRGRTISMRLCEGVVESVENNVAVVKYGKQGRIHAHVRALSLVGQPTLISRTVEAIREAGRKCS